MSRGPSIAGLGLDMSRSRLDSSASYMRESLRQPKPVQDFNRQFSAIEQDEEGLDFFNGRKEPDILLEIPEEAERGLGSFRYSGL